MTHKHEALYSKMDSSKVRDKGNSVLFINWEILSCPEDSLFLKTTRDFSEIRSTLLLMISWVKLLFILIWFMGIRHRASDINLFWRLLYKQRHPVMTNVLFQMSFKILVSKRMWIQYLKQSIVRKQSGNSD